MAKTTKKTKTTTAKSTTTVKKASAVLEAPVCFQWGVIVAGAFTALAISFVLLQFGAAIGLSIDAPLRGDGDITIASWGMIATGLWLLWVQLMASMAGGYLVGRMRNPTPHLTDHENEIRDGVYGLVAWSTSTVLVVIGAALSAAFATYVSLATDTFDANEVMSQAEQNAAIIYAFGAGATSLVSAVAAWWAATVAGDHRDKGVDFSSYISFR